MKYKEVYKLWVAALMAACDVQDAVTIFYFILKKEFIEKKLFAAFYIFVLEKVKKRASLFQNFPELMLLTKSYLVTLTTNSQQTWCRC